MRWVQDTYIRYEAGTIHLQGVWGGYKTSRRGTRQVQETYMGYKVCMSPLQGYKMGMRYQKRGTRRTLRRGMEWVQDTCKGYEVETRHLQEIWCRYETPKGVWGRYERYGVSTRAQGGYKITTSSTMWVQDTYKGYKVGTRCLQGVQGSTRHLQGVQDT